MAFPSSADIDLTKLDNDNDSIKDSRAELHKMAGYVNDIITEGPGGGGGSTISGLFTVQDIDSAGSTAKLEIDTRDSDFANDDGTIIMQSNDEKDLILGTRTDAGTINNKITIDGAGNFIALDTGTSQGYVAFNQGVTFHPGITTTQRNAITPQNGYIIYNSTTNKFQGYANGVWVDLH